MPKKDTHKTSIGGQAVIEGDMMRGSEKIATVVRKPDGDIAAEIWDVPASRKLKLFKLPIIRGCIGFFDSLVIGIKSLMFSADFVEIDEEDEKKPGKEKPKKEKPAKEKSDKAKDIAIYFAVMLSLVMSVGLFMFLPKILIEVAVEYIKIENHMLKVILEGCVRIALFIGYLSLTSLMPDMKRVFMYHGAEHKSIHCFENGDELTVENVKKQTRLHPRCGTSFLFIVMIVSIVVFSVIRWTGSHDFYLHIIVPLLLRLALLPVVAGISYEIIKFAGRHDNFLTRIISAPGMFFQKITTKEPTDDQIEVAIAALKAVMPEKKGDDAW